MEYIIWLNQLMKKEWFTNFDQRLLGMNIAQWKNPKTYAEIDKK